MTNLFYLMGASGVGKDSLLEYARHRLPLSTSIVFGHRYITRPSSAGGENHVALSEEEFQQRLSLNCFAMHWRSHNTSYGIGVEINQWLEMGLSVVVNGSRDYLDQSAKQYPNLVPVLITASKDQLRQRLQARGRESQLEMEQRLKRAEDFQKKVDHPRLIKLSNDRSIQQAGDQLLRIITGELSPACV